MIEGIESNYAEQQARESSRSKLGFMLAGLGVGGMLAYLISRGARTSEGRAKRIESSGRYSTDNVVDDQGTTQDEAAQILRNLRDRGFEASDEKLALALGRTADEIQAFSSGREVIDDDVIMKARGIAMHRGIRVD
ncbi:MAG TPA: hypothetical protein VLA93_14600 [Pyrinomonadaceae bacterium]|nr:hypothetical protein [Pyrinomonadaceae bacterium]